MTQPTLLYNGVYWPAMGHAIEAIQFARGYYDSNPGLRISLLLNEDTPSELAKLCPWVDHVYRVRVSAETPASADHCFGSISTDWDYIIGDPRLRLPAEGIDAPFKRFHAKLLNQVTARMASGFAEDDTLAFCRPHQIRIRPPRPNRAVRALIAPLEGERTGVAVLLAGGSFPPPFWPSKESWIDILNAIASSHPAMQFFLIGNNRPDNPYLKTQFPPNEVTALLSQGLPITDCRDVDLFGQLAIVKSCRLFVSPHSGFGLGALAVGTPWLTISGGRWKEHFFNGVPFYSLLPDPEHYPAFDEGGTVPIIDSDGSLRIPSMRRQRFRESLQEIADASSMLLHGHIDYETCLAHHWQRLEAFARKQEALSQRRQARSANELDNIKDTVTSRHLDHERAEFSHRNSSKAAIAPVEAGKLRGK